MKNLASYIDHTLLKPEAVSEQLEELCREAREYRFASVCVNSSRVAQCHALLRDSEVRVCSVVGFPLGAMESTVKAREAEVAVQQGADEIDMVMNIGLLKEGDLDGVEEDIRRVKQACGDAVLKVIIEACLLTDEQKVTACRLSKQAGADFVKTSTGFSTHGATVEDVALMRKTVGPDLGVKAAGGVRSVTDAEAMIAAGANRLGTSSGVALVQGQAADRDY